MRGITRLCLAAALVLVLVLATGCGGGMGQTMSEGASSGEDGATPAQETGGSGEFEAPSAEFPEVQQEEPSPTLFP